MPVTVFVNTEQRKQSKTVSCLDMGTLYSHTVDPRLTDGSTYRHFELQTSLAAKFRFDLQPENRLTDQKKTKME